MRPYQRLTLIELQQLYYDYESQVGSFENKKRAVMEEIALRLETTIQLSVQVEGHGEIEK